MIKVFLPNIDQSAFEKSREIVASGIEATEAGIWQIKKDLRL
jgi:hypothetical protein